MEPAAFRSPVTGEAARSSQALKVQQANQLLSPQSRDVRPSRGTPHVYTKSCASPDLSPTAGPAHTHTHTRTLAGRTSCHTAARLQLLPLLAPCKRQFRRAGAPGCHVTCPAPRVTGVALVPARVIGARNSQLARGQNTTLAGTSHHEHGRRVTAQKVGPHAPARCTQHTTRADTARTAADSAPDYT